MGAGGLRARRSGRRVVRTGSSARCRYAAARRRKTTGLGLWSMGELTCPVIPRRLVMVPRLQRSLFAMQRRPWVSEERESLAGSQNRRRLAEGPWPRRGVAIGLVLPAKVPVVPA
jgi:hypothetical protein